MKVLIADAFPKDRIADIAALGVTVEHRPDLAVKDLPAAAAAASILVVRGKQVPAEVFERGDALSLVIRAGAGVNTIDVGAASRRGVYVANCPGQNAIAVAELAKAYALKKANPAWILMGERDGRPPAGFDYGNSPANIEQVDFSHKTIVQTTSAGTQGLVNAVHADEIITGSFVNAILRKFGVDDLAHRWIPALLPVGGA